jgi:hypothetical protein
MGAVLLYLDWQAFIAGLGYKRPQILYQYLQLLTVLKEVLV